MLRTLLQSSLLASLDPNTPNTSYDVAGPTESSGYFRLYGFQAFNLGKMVSEYVCFAYSHSFLRPCAGNVRVGVAGAAPSNRDDDLAPVDCRENLRRRRIILFVIFKFNRSYPPRFIADGCS